MEQVIGQIFRNKRVELDGHSYEKCTFINCELYTELGYFKLTENDLSGCKLNLGGFAQNIAVLIRMFYPDMPLWIEGKESKLDVLERMKKRLQDEGLV